MGIGRMILQSLRELAFREKLLDSPDYEPKPVAWIISLDRNGKFVDVISTVTDDGIRRKPTAKTMSIPRRRGRTSGAAADFLVDKSEYVLGALPKNPGEERSVDLRARLDKRRELFAGELRKAYENTHEPGLRACVAFLESERQACIDRLDRVGYVSNDLFAFEVDGFLVHETGAVQSYFSEFRRTAQAHPEQCLVCGEYRTPVDKHPAFQLRGGTSSGIPLVTFNADAFESYGWLRNENAPVCRNCADAYGTGLTRLLSDRYRDPAHPERTLPKRAVGISTNTTAVFWAASEDQFVDLCAGLFNEANPQAVEALLKSPFKGSAAASGSCRFFCLALTGSQGRAILRSLHTGLLPDVERNVQAYFRALTAISERPAPLYLLLRSLAVAGKAENLDPNLASELFMAILFGYELPRSVLAAACTRCRAEQRVTTHRAILLTTYFRNKTDRKDMFMGLNSDEADAGYRLGRLLALLERLQARAQNNPNKTIVDRYYGAASTRPGTVFPTLLRLSVHHAAKLETGLANYFQRLQGEVLSGLSRFPTTLTLEQQGLFALGYFHQRFQRSADERSGEVESTVAEEK